MNKLAKVSTLSLIFLSLVPGGFIKDTVDLGHFFSSVHMFEYALKHGFQFGVDLIDNVGPYGYLHYPYIYAGGAAGVKTIWYAAICFVYAYYATALITRIESWPHRGLFLFSIVFFPLQLVSPWFSFEIIPRLAILFSAVYFITELREKESWHEFTLIIFNGLFYAFLTLEKASNAYYLGLVIFVLCTYWLSRAQRHYALSLISSFLVGIFVFWLAAGQNITGLPTYFSSMSFFISSYQEALGQEMAKENLLYGLVYCGVAALLFSTRLVISFLQLKSRSKLSSEVYRSILVVALLFLSWKHGMLRGASSYGTFLYVVPILFGYFCLYPIAFGGGSPERRSLNQFSIWQILNYRGSLYTLLLLVIWSNLVIYQQGNGQEVGVIRELKSRFWALVSYRPVYTLEVLDKKLAKLKFDNALPPLLKQTVQSGRVDEFGSSPEILLLNDLNYRPRPVPIDFVVGNSALNEMNGDYYKDLDSAPDYIFLKDFGLRLSDSAAYLSLLFNYQVVETFQNWLVLRKQVDAWQTIERQEINEVQADYGEWIPLSTNERSILWVQIEATPSLFGKLKRFFYKPDFLRLEIALDDGTIRSLPVSVAQLHSGFMLNPVIKTKEEILMDVGDENAIPGDWANSFRISMETPEKTDLFRNLLQVKFFEVKSSRLSIPGPMLRDSVHTNPMSDLISADLPTALTKFPLSLVTSDLRDDVLVTGLSGLESNGKERWRWALGPATRVRFYMDPSLPDQARNLLLKFAFKNGVPIPNQSVTMRLNGTVVRRFSPEEVARHELINADVVLSPKKRDNILEISYEDWNHGKKHYGPNDPRRLAVVIMALSLERVSK